MSNRQEYWKGIDRIFRLPRVWSNRELDKFAKLFEGDIANISGWQDKDKEGKFYKDYFVNASSYSITNYKSDARGFQGNEGEIFLDLTAPLPKELENKFDVVFNHTVLEHIYEIQEAFANICAMTKDIAIIVVPFLQEMHADYGDFWRFTPQSMQRMFEKNNMDMIYCSFNSHINASVYLFCIGTKKQEKWKGKIPNKTTHIDVYTSNNGFQNWVGCHAIQNEKYNSNKVKKSFLEKIYSFWSSN